MVRGQLHGMHSGRGSPFSKNSIDKRIGRGHTPPSQPQIRTPLMSYKKNIVRLVILKVWFTFIVS